MNYNNFTDKSDNSHTIMPPGDMLKVMVLQRREDALISIQKYEESIARAGQGPKHFVISRVLALYYDLLPALERWLKPVDFKKLQRQVNAADPVRSIAGFHTINRLMDERKLTRLDTRREYNAVIVEQENEAKGL